MKFECGDHIRMICDGTPLQRDILGKETFLDKPLAGYPGYWLTKPLLYLSEGSVALVFESDMELIGRGRVQ